MNREFKGVWIPKDIYLNPNLSLVEKILYTEIQSLDMSEKGCFASNSYFAEFLGVSNTTISQGITKLKDLGYIYQESFDGRKRILKSSLQETGNQSFKDVEPAFQKSKGRVSETANILIQDTNTDNSTIKNGEVSPFTNFVSVYDKFCKDRIGVGCKMNGAEGKALKSIIQYLKLHIKGDSQSALVESWKYILSRWDALDDFYKNQMKLTQINSNLINILNQLKNNKNGKSSDLESKIRTRLHSQQRTRV
jgi:biotin operon repressor